MRSSELTPTVGSIRSSAWTFDRFGVTGAVTEARAGRVDTHGVALSTKRRTPSGCSNTGAVHPLSAGFPDDEVKTFSVSHGQRRAERPANAFSSTGVAVSMWEASAWQTHVARQGHSNACSPAASL